MGKPLPSLLICYAHPDDETFGCGGTTALMASRGIAVHILLATRGEAGLVRDPDLARSAERDGLGAVREAEARAAAEALGAAGIAFLDYQDSQLDAADPAVLARQVAAEIRRVRPSAVVTFGPEGVYGHPDHVAIHRAATDAYALAAEPAVVIGDLAPHAAARLFYQVIPAEQAARLNDSQGPVVLDGRAYPFVGYADEAITTRMDISSMVDRKLEALARHRTQTAGRMDRIRARLLGQPASEYFVLARTRVQDDPGLAGDLLAGLA